MNSKGNSLNKKSEPMITTSTISRLAGLSAVIAGVCYIVVGMFHPLNVLASVTTASWTNVHIFAIAMCFFGLLGITGLYVRQVKESGWLGLVGFVLLSLWLALLMGFTFVEIFILPRLASESPAFVEGFLGMFNGAPTNMNLGILPTLWTLSGPLYMLGGLVFGIATFRAGILARWAGVILAFGTALTPVAAVLPPELEPKVTIPVGIALVWLGYSLLAERRAKSAEVQLDQKIVRPEPSQVA